MASGVTGEFYCGTYIRGRIRWETTAVSGGHNVTLRMDVYRTNIYSGDIANNQNIDTLHCDGQTASWYNTTISNQRTWHELFAMTKFVGHSAAKTITIGWDCSYPQGWPTPSYYNGSWYGNITLEAIGQKASGLAASPGNKTWNTINVSGSISSWGIGPGPNYVALAVFPGNKSTASWGGPRVEWTADNQGNTRSWNNKQVSVQLEGGMTFKGCMPYKVGIWANNRYEAAWYIRNETYYTPPAPPVSVEILSDVPVDSESTDVTFRITESQTNNVSGVLVKTKLKSISDFPDIPWGTEFISAKHAPGTPVTFTIRLPQNRYIAIGNSNSVTLSFAVSSVFYYGQNDQYSVQSTEKYTFETGNFKAFGVDVRNYVTKQMEPPSPEYHWNDDRTALIVTATANSDYADYVQVKWGYDDTVSSILWQGNTGDTPVTSGWSHTESILYPNHGAGQFIYLQVRSRYQNNTWEDGDVFAVPVANPIIGVATYTNSNKKYIVDIVEHKADNTITPLWQNGQRIVKK